MCHEGLTRLRAAKANKDTSLPDALGSTLQLTDATQAGTASYRYEPYGKTTVGGSPGSNRLAYTGREEDGTGLYYYRTRYYHPGVGRFVAEDLIGLDGGSNLYGYVRGNPLSDTDPKDLDVVMDNANRAAGLQPDIPPNRYSCFVMCLAAKTTFELGVAGKAGKVAGAAISFSLELPATGATVSWLTGSSTMGFVGEITGFSICWKECTEAANCPR